MPVLVLSFTALGPAPGALASRPPCASPGNTGAQVRITAPRPAARLSPRTDAEVLVTGTASSSRASGLSVSLYGDDTLLGTVTDVDTAHDDPSTRGREARPGSPGRWSLPVTPPPGDHVITACLRRGGTVLARSQVRVRMARPGGGTGLAPETVRLDDAVTEVDGTRVVLDGDHGLAPGQILLSGPVDAAPAGLAARVVSAAVDDGRTVLDVAPVTFGEVVWWGTHRQELTLDPSGDDDGDVTRLSVPWTLVDGTVSGAPEGVTVTGRGEGRGEFEVVTRTTVTARTAFAVQRPTDWSGAGLFSGMSVDLTGEAHQDSGLDARLDGTVDVEADLAAVRYRPVEVGPFTLVATLRQHLVGRVRADQGVHGSHSARTSWRMGAWTSDGSRLTEDSSLSDVRADDGGPFTEDGQASVDLSVRSEFDLGLSGLLEMGTTTRTALDADVLTVCPGRADARVVAGLTTHVVSRAGLGDRREAGTAHPDTEYVIRSGVHPGCAEPYPAETWPTEACDDGCAVAWGAGHLSTSDGMRVDLVPLGDLVLARTPDAAYEVQVRHETSGAPEGTTRIGAVAARMLGHVVRVDADPRGLALTVDGTPVGPDDAPKGLPDGAGAAFDGPSDGVVQQITLTWPDGAALVVHQYENEEWPHLDVAVAAAPEARGTLQGVVGAADGVLTGEIVPRDGTVGVGPDAPADEIAQAVRSWRVREGEQLMPDGAEGTSGDRPVQDEPAPARSAEAAAGCRRHGVVVPLLVGQCAGDVVAAEPFTAATSAVFAQQVSAAVSEVPAGTVVLGSAAGQPWVDEHGSRGYSHLTYGHGGCTALDAGLRCEGGTWPQLPGAHHVWTHQFSEPGQYRAEFDLVVSVAPVMSGRPLLLEAWGDDRVDIEVDAEPVLSTTYHDGIGTVPLELDAGYHTVHVTVVNEPIDDWWGNPGGVVWRIVTV